MKIIFSPGFDSQVYKNDTELFNKIFVGELQLLGLLERELGLSGNFKTQKEREVEYLEVLDASIRKDANVFIADSYKVDPIGISKELLRWRDQLKLANWNFELGISSRLDFIAKIEEELAENNVLSLGVSDRWIEVLRMLEKVENVDIGEIEIDELLELNHPFYSKLFTSLKAKGVNISTNKLDIEKGGGNLNKVKSILTEGRIGVKLDINDTSFTIIKSSDEIITADFLANQLKNNKEFNPLVINRNNAILDASFTALDMPNAGAKLQNVNPQIIQLFKLATSLLFKNVNPYNLLSFLRLPLLPFSKALATRLSKVLLKTSGVDNEEWLSTIESHKEKFKSEEKKKGTLQTIELYLERTRTDEVSKEDVVALYTDMLTWATQRMNLPKQPKDIKNQLGYLSAMCTNFISTLNKINVSSFNQVELENSLSKIYEPVTIPNLSKEIGSYTVIQDPSQVYDDVDTIVWVDVYNQPLKANWYDFLFRKEKEDLLNKDVWLWSNENQVELRVAQLFNGVLKANKRLYLCISEKSKGETTSAHPLMINLTASIENLDKFIYNISFSDEKITVPGLVPTIMEAEKRTQLPQPVNYLSIKNGNLIAPRSKESYSSINNLIQYPLDWVLQYQAKITDKGESEIDNMMKIKGNLSHLVVQELLKNELLPSANVDEEVNKLLEKFVIEHALPFNLPENKFEYNAFKIQLKMSVKVLLNLIKENGLSFVEAEAVVAGPIEYVEFSGFVDLLFDKGGVPVIVDLKWTFSDKKYYKILEEEKAIQLALYDKLKGGSPISAYFLLSHGKLFTTDNRLWGANVTLVKIEEPATVDDRVIARLMNSYKYRLKELTEGKIELAEEMDLAELDYYNDIEKLDLLELDNNYVNKTLSTKKENYYSDNGLFKGKIK